LRSRSNKKVCILGLDGVGLINLRIFAKSFALSGINKVLNKGLVCSTLSIPPYTPLTWVSIFAGVNPGKHGVYGFYKVNHFRACLATSCDVMYPRIFEMLSMFNRRSVVINVPLVYPVHGLVGLRNLVVVSDWASPRQFIYPKQYEERYREYLVEPPHKWSATTSVRSYVKSVEAFLEKRLDLYCELLEKEKFDSFIVVFSELDWLMHKIPDIVIGKQLNLAYKVISLIDGFVRRAYEICDLIALTSDHGFTISKLFLGVNSILAKNGLMAISYRLNPSKLLRLQEQGTTSSANDGKHVFGHLPSLAFHRLFMLAEKLVPQHLLSKLESNVSISMEMDPLRSRAFMLESGNWGVYVKNGYLDAVEKVFKNIRFIKKILRKEEVFWGPHVERAPDLILVPQNHVSFDPRIYARSTYTGYVGEHEPHAMIAFYGDDVLRFGDACSEVDVSIYDLVPTVLAYMGLPMPSDTDGRPLTDIFNVELSVAEEKANYVQKFKVLRKALSLRLS